MKNLIHFRKKNLNMNMSISYEKMPFLVKKAKGVYFYDNEGNKYLDCINNVTHIGHCNSDYQRAMTHQLKTLVTNSRFLYECLETASTKLLSMMPKELSRITWTNSGSESNDLAIQMANGNGLGPRLKKIEALTTLSKDPQERVDFAKAHFSETQRPRECRAVASRASSRHPILRALGNISSISAQTRGP